MATKKNAEETAVEKWHNRTLDENGGKVYLVVSKTFSDSHLFNNFGEPVVRYAGSFYWEDAQKAYPLYLQRKVGNMSMTHDPMKDKKDPDYYTTDEKQREEIYAQNPYAFGATHIKTATGLVTVPLDHEGKAWVPVKEGATDGGADKLVFVPNEFKDRVSLARPAGKLRYNIDGSVNRPTRRYKHEQDGKHWYIIDSGEGVRANIVQRYSDFFSGRIYEPGENVLMYQEEAERAKREGYATFEPVVKMQALTQFIDDYIKSRHNPYVREIGRLSGEIFYATQERAEELESAGKAVPADKADEYRLANPGFFKGNETLSGESTLKRGEWF